MSPTAVQHLYTKEINHYESFISAFRSPQAVRALLHSCTVLRPGLRVLDAGCGFGMVTFALLDVLRAKGIDVQNIDAFDLTPAMLNRFEKLLAARNISGVQVQQADVLALEELPRSWTNYDLILSASMLEYVPKQRLAHALAALRSRLAPGGKLVVMITRKTPETKVLVEWLWHANRYTKAELLRALKSAGLREIVFRRFPMRYFWLNRANYVVKAES